VRWAELRAVALAAIVFALGAPAAAAAGEVPILMYHRVAARPFQRQVAALSHAGYRPVTLSRLMRGWAGTARLPARPVVLTFDDGYRSQFGVAATALRRRGWPGVLNLELARVGAAGGLRRSQVRRMRAWGWEIASHTLTHPDLTSVDAETLRREVAGSREAIAHRFQVHPAFFCYPFGHVDEDVEAAVRAAGYRGATTTRRGAASPADDPFALPRIAVGPRTSAAALLARLRASV
jgi:peptidoglycan/xylan/chitin deacetylase (PgdA/CDA1 family)